MLPGFFQNDKSCCGLTLQIGSVDGKVEVDEGGSKVNQGKEIGCGFVESAGYSASVFELTEVALYFVSLLV